METTKKTLPEKAPEVEAAPCNFRSDFKPARAKRTIRFANKEDALARHKTIADEFEVAFGILAK